MFVTFENGKTWPVKENYVEALVDIPLSDIIDHNHEGFLDILAEEAVGNTLLADISYDVIGAPDTYTVRLKVTGDITEVAGNEEDGVTEHAINDALYGTLASLFGWSDDVRAHAMATSGVTYENECIIPLACGRELRCPAHPLPCSYVRLVEAGHELMFWNSDEWRDDTQEVIGAILGLAKGGELVESAVA